MTTTGHQADDGSWAKPQNHMANADSDDSKELELGIGDNEQPRSKRCEGPSSGHQEREPHVEQQGDYEHKRQLLERDDADHQLVPESRNRPRSGSTGERHGAERDLSVYIRDNFSEQWNPITMSRWPDGDVFGVQP